MFAVWFQSRGSWGPLLEPIFKNEIQRTSGLKLWCMDDWKCVDCVCQCLIFVINKRAFKVERLVHRPCSIPTDHL